jgi:uncharacterized membrane protein (DUF2068 family)
MKNYKIAAILMIIHGGFMELGGSLTLIPMLVFGNGTVKVEQYFSFIVPYLQENIHLMMVMGGIYGIVRLIGAIGLLKNRLWGLVLSITNSVITMALMIFMLPAGIMDGLLACTALILMLTQYFGKRKIIE